MMNSFLIKKFFHARIMLFILFTIFPVVYCLLLNEIFCALCLLHTFMFSNKKTTSLFVFALEHDFYMFIFCAFHKLRATGL